MDAKYSMLDALGINQHHDAVTGTGKQAVADDYALKLYTGMDNNSDKYSDMISEKIESLTGLNSSMKWMQCSQTNSTYLDCPVADLPEQTFAVAIQNPSSIENSKVRIAVPHGKYNVQLFNQSTQEYQNASASVVCHDDLAANKTEMTSCFMDIESTVPSKSFALLQIQYDEDADLTVASTDLNEGDSIGDENDIKLTLKSVDADLSLLTFEQYKSISNATETF
jgi:hypothetical protein